MSQLFIQYYEKLSQHFLRKGKKRSINKLFSNLLFQHAKSNKLPFINTLKDCYDSTIPYIQVKAKTRKYGKRIKYQLKWINKLQSYKLALFAFKKHIFGQTKDRFSLKLDSGFKSFEQQKKLRDNIHQLAFKYLPKKYLKKNNIKIKNLKGIKAKQKKNSNFMMKIKQLVSGSKIKNSNLFLNLKDKTILNKKKFISNS